MFTSEFAEIWYCMPKEVLDMSKEFVTALRATVPDILIYEGVPNFLDMAKEQRHRLMILDDMGDETYKVPDFKSLLARISHHSEISVIMVNQNFFASKDHSTTIARNMSSLILFNHRSDPTHISVLSRRFLRTSNFASDCFNYMRSHLGPNAQHYLCIDCETRSQLPELMNCRSQILSHETPIFFLHPE
jgi:hypothetical protein